MTHIDNHTTRLWLLLIAVFTIGVLHATSTAADEATFLADLEALTTGPHRLSGTAEGRAAADHIVQRLEAIGVDRVLTLSLPVWQTEVLRCEVEIDGKTVDLLPLRPNVITNPITPPRGITGPMVYIGQGMLEDIAAGLDQIDGVDDLRGAIAVIDYASHDNWQIAFSLGAAALIFIDDGNLTNPDPLHTGVPANLIRLYARADPTTGLSNGIDLTKPQGKATVYSEVIWQRSVGENIIGLIRGTNPRFNAERQAPEALILSTHYDSFGNVPQDSPGARGAANVAGLLNAATQFVESPPQRHVAVVFLDNHARGQQGARVLYDALMMTNSQQANLITSHTDEAALIGKALALLDARSDPAVDADSVNPNDTERTVVMFLKQTLKEQAEWAQDELQVGLQAVRMGWVIADRESGDIRPDETTLAERGEVENEFSVSMRRWDDIRRALHEDRFEELSQEINAAASGENPDNDVQSRTLAHALKTGGIEAMRAEASLVRSDVIERLTSLTRQRLQRRLDELALSQQIDQEREALRQAFSEGGDPLWITLVTTFDFGDATDVWGPVVGEWSPWLFKTNPIKSGVDDPGLYVRLFAAMRGLVDPQQDIGFDLQTVQGDTSFGSIFTPGRYVNGGAVAGQYGIYNFAMMTGYDGRLRDGHPSDTVDRLNWRRIYDQSARAGDLMRRFADSTGLSQPRRFGNNTVSKYTVWNNGKSKGPSASLRVTGGLSENRPATGALVAMWPGSNNLATSGLAAGMQNAIQMPAYEPVIYEPVDANGNFDVIALRKDRYAHVNVLGGLFNTRGTIEAISTFQSVSQAITKAIRTDLFFAKPGEFVFRSTFRVKPPLLEVLRANANTPYRNNRSLVGQLGSTSAFFISDRVVDDRSKVFQPLGPVILGAFDANHPAGNGVALSAFTNPPWLMPDSAEDLWNLNESRFSRLRSRGVTRADLETLHSQAGRMLEQSQQGLGLIKREPDAMRSQMLSQRIYGPLRGSMDDLVHSVVLLLLLAIPFAFVMERLVIGAASIYGRIAGFVAMFFVTFGLLYWLHPGFAIASTPIIIFLAFAIILLSSLVIYIVSRKFSTELKAIQGQGQASHELANSTAGAMLAAVSMGVSTMRRRPTRTTLTAITVVMLTFTILCFASFTTEIGVRSIYEGPALEGIPDAIMTRNLDYTALQTSVLESVIGQEGTDGLIAPNYWAIKTGTIPIQPTYFTIADQETGRMELVNAVMGVDPAELERWPELAAAIQSQPGEIVLGDDDIYLPQIVQQLLGLQIGQRILVRGVPATFRGTLDGARLQSLRHVDGKPVLPVDFQDQTNWRQSDETNQPDADSAITSDVQRDFTYLGSDQVAIASNALARRLDGSLHRLSIYPGQDTNTIESGQQLAELVAMPVWAAGEQGVDRMLLTHLTSVAGGMRLAVPLLLGGLIIFGTLLGSISDREREIFTFSALGLSPMHVGVLFFAEATVYAVLGGMGGQLLAQFVALAVSGLTRAGLIGPVSINYSSTNSLFAIGVVMATVLISAIYPAMRASKSANPGLQRAWRVPKPEGDQLKMVFPFTVSAYDITGIVSFLAEHFRRHDDAGLGEFAAHDTHIGHNTDDQLQLAADLALAPFDLGVTQHMTLTAVPSEIPGVDEVAIHLSRQSGTNGDWVRANKVFIRGLRRQFLLWRTLSADMIEQYRMETLQSLSAPDTTKHAQPKETPIHG